MSTRQFFVWSGWAIAITLGLPLFLVVALAALAALGQTANGDSINLPRPSIALPVIVQAADFPSSYYFEEEEVPWQMYTDMPRTDESSYYRFIANPDAQPEYRQYGHVTVALYVDPYARSRAYEAIRQEIGSGTPVKSIDFAERGMQVPPSNIHGGTEVLFVRCEVVVHLAMEGDTLQQMLNYAHQLDGRIAGAICSK